LQEGITLSTNRNQIPDQNYIQQAHQIRQKAQLILDGSLVAEYPPEIRQFVTDSQYAVGLPKRIAPILLHGFPENKLAAISSNELQMYLNTAQTLRSELNVLKAAFDRFRIDPISLPAGTVSLDLKIPRDAFSEDAIRFSEILEPFLRIMSYLAELVTNTRSPPVLVYTATTDPTLGLALIPAAAWGFLKFYKLVLEVVEKHISLHKTIKTFRESGIGEEAVAKMQEHVDDVVQKDINRVIDSTVNSVPHKVAPERTEEIKNALNRDAPVIIEAIANGTRVSLSLESRDRISLIIEQVEGVTPEQVQQELAAQRQLEQKITAIVAPLGGAERTFLPVQQRDPHD
jgi:hypothetical protein